jgi:hypothetical protein
MAAIGLFRVLVIFYTWIPAVTDVWAAWWTLGGIFLTAGLFLWTKRKP